MCFTPQRRALFDISTSKSGLILVFFVHFDLEMCFAPQRCALFRQLPKVVRTWCVLYILTWKCASRHNGVHFFDISTSKSGLILVFFVHFDLEMCFALQRCALFRQLPKVVRTWCVLYILTWKCASRHNGVHFFISHLASWLRTPCFSEVTVRPSGAPKSLEKHSESRLPYLFSRTCIFFLLTFCISYLLTS